MRQESPTHVCRLGGPNLFGHFAHASKSHLAYPPNAHTAFFLTKSCYHGALSLSLSLVIGPFHGLPLVSALIPHLQSPQSWLKSGCGNGHDTFDRDKQQRSAISGKFLHLEFLEFSPLNFSRFLSQEANVQPWVFIVTDVALSACERAVEKGNLAGRQTGHASASNSLISIC